MFEINQRNKCYKNILTVNQIPHGPLRRLIHRIMMPRLSPFQVSAACNPIENCVLAIIMPNYSGGINNYGGINRAYELFNKFAAMSNTPAPQTATQTPVKQ